MGMKALISVIQKRQLLPLLKLSGMITPFYRLGYIAALVNNGYFQTLADAPKSLDEIMVEMGIAKEQSEGLAAWLQVGIRLKEVRFGAGKYQLNGVSQQLARLVENDALLAITQEVATLHYKLILETPAKLKSGEKWTLGDQDGELIARSSRILEPLQNEVIERIFPTTKPLRLLEIGCGSGIYIKQAAARNPQLAAVGVELQSAVVEMARQNIENWQLQERVRIEAGDIRTKEYSSEFDIVTLYNNIYYFPVEERVALLKHLRSFLKVGGYLILITGCQGGQPPTELLNLWSATTEGCGRLPEAEEMVEQMIAAGFEHVQKQKLMPGDAFYMFLGYQVI